MKRMITFVTLSGEQASEHRDAVLKVWSVVFGPVDDAAAWEKSPWDSHRSRSGYRLVLAHDDERLVGFAWGYTGDRGQYWSDYVAREVGPQVDGWLGGHFEFVELAVIPEARGKGVGGRLHDSLLAGLDHERALLATSDRADDPAVRLYTSRGWVKLATYGGDRQVMGLTVGQRNRGVSLQ
jgi:GNAT superfamily N-acetyltransferase